jgi:two-component system KDP operon response regulator KdpE
VIDDDPEMVELVRLIFEREGAEVFAAQDGREGICQFGMCRPDLILLDVMMPALDGWETCRLFRGFTDVPIIFLTVLNRELDVIRGFDCGASDYVTKPFKRSILVARARAALRSATSRPRPSRQAMFEDGYLEIDVEGRRVWVGGKPVRLTATEFRLLSYLVENAGQVLTYGQILERVWGGGCLESVGYVHVYVSHLRRKIEWDPSHPAYILTERGVGYRFAARSPNRRSGRVA